MPFNDFLCDRKADAVAVVAAALVKALEHLEHPLAVLFIDADAVVRDVKKKLSVFSFASDPDSWRICSAKFQGVADQVLEKLSQLRLICLHRRQSFANNFCIAFVDCHLQPGEDVFENNRRFDNYGRSSV